MKPALISLLLFCCLLSGATRLVVAKSNKYIIATDAPAAISINYTDKEQTECLAPWQKNGCGYLISCNKPEKTFLQNDSNANLRCKLYDLYNNNSTTWFILKPKQSMSIDRCMKQFADNSFFSSASNVWNRITDFFVSAQRGIFYNGENMVMQNTQPDSLFTWITPNNTRFIQPQLVQLQFQTDAKDLTCQLFNQHNALIANFSALNEHISDEINFSHLNKLIDGNLAEGQNYRLNCTASDKLKGKTVSHELNFYILSKNEYNQLKKFLKN